LSTVEWRFTDDQGVEQVVSTDELCAALASGKLAPSTSVWRDGMKEWSPAFSMPELTEAITAGTRVSRGSIPPISGAAMRLPTPPPVPIPVGKPRGPMHTLTGLEPVELAESLFQTTPDAGGREPMPSEPTDAGGDWSDVTDLIPKAPAVPRDAPRMVPPKRRAPSLPPPPMPAIPTPPPLHPQTPKAVARRPTLTGTGHKGPRPGPPPRPRSIPPAAATPAPGEISETALAPTPAAPTAAAPIGKGRPRSIPPPPPRRLHKTLEMSSARDGGSKDTPRPAPTAPTRRSTPPPLRRQPSMPPAGLPPAIAQARTLVSPATSPQTVDFGSAHTPAPPTATPLTGAALPRIAPHRPTSMGLGTKRAIPREEPNDPPTVTKATSTEIASSPKLGTRTKVSGVSPATPSPVTKEGTEIIAASPVLNDARAAFAAEMKKDAPAPEPAPRRARTMEMEVGDHQKAAAKEVTSPDSRAPAELAQPKSTPRELIALGDGEDEATSRMKLETLNAADKSPSRPPTSAAPSSRAPTSTPPVSAAAASGARSQSGSARAVRPEDTRRRRKKGGFELTLSSLLAASGFWVVGLVAFFFVGRASGFRTESPQARDGVADSFLAWETPSSVAPTGPVGPLPCWVTRQPVEWVPSASKSVPFEMHANGEDAIDVGVAVDDREGIGLRVDLKSGKIDEQFRKKTDADITRVVPTGQGEGFYVSESGAREYLPIDGDPTLALVFEKNQIGMADMPSGEPTKLWSLDGDDEVSVATVVKTSGPWLLTFKRGDAVYAGYFDKQKHAAGDLVVLKGSGGKLGKPRGGFNGTEIAITFADKPDGDDTGYEIRLGRAPLGSLPPETSMIPLPEGGPGKNAISPDIVGLSNGRWLLMWTEGESGARAIRAQTYDSTMQPIGDPIALSPPAGSFGQAILGVSGNYTTAAFLQAQDDGFQLWGAVLQCGF